MPTHDGVRVHDIRGCPPIPPRVGEQHPKQAISPAELGTTDGALEHGQLLTECQILERDRSVSTADQRERSKRDDERSQHELSCPAVNHRINRGWRSDSGEEQCRGRSSTPMFCSAPMIVKITVKRTRAIELIDQLSASGNLVMNARRYRCEGSAGFQSATCDTMQICGLLVCEKRDRISPTCSMT